jgi:multidrug efflux pump subunit AcrA (membrane-fusion protein)
MNKKYLIPIPVVAIAVVLFVIFKKNKVETVKPEHKAITEAVYASGFLVPRNEYKVYALSDGYIVSKGKEGGDEVKRGEEIYKVQNDAVSSKLGASSSALELAKLNASESSPVLLDLKNKNAKTTRLTISATKTCSMPKQLRRHNTTRQLWLSMFLPTI